MKPIPPQPIKPAPIVAPTVLPTEDSLPVEELSDHKILIHSLSGVGKTTFLMSIQQVAKAILLDGERGSLSHKGRIVRLTDWSHFTRVVDALVNRNHEYEMVCIDPLDAVYNMAWSHINTVLNISHPGDAASGKGYDRITSALMEQLNKLQLSGLGLVCSVHTMTGTIKIRGVEYNNFQPSFVGGSPRSAYKRMEDFFDVIGFLHVESMVKPPTIQGKGRQPVVDVRAIASGSLIEEEVRVLDFSASQFWVTKDRTGRFKTPIVLPEDWREDWAKIVEVWEPETKGTTSPPGEAEQKDMKE